MSALAGEGLGGDALPFPWLPLICTADQTVANSATLANSTYLQFAVAASTKYRFRARIFFDTTAAGDFKWDINGPAGISIFRCMYLALPAGASLAAGASTVVTAINTVVSLTGTGTTGGYVMLEGIVHNGSNAGTIAFRFAQNSQTNDSGAIVRAGSSMEYAPL